MAGDPLLEEFDRQIGLKKKYAEQANPNAPTTVTGDNLLNEFDRVTGFNDTSRQDITVNPPSAPQSIPEFRTDTNTFVPDLGAVYENQGLGDDENVAAASRRQSVRAALRESIRTEEQLKAFGLGEDIPSEGTQLPSYLTVPLQALKQLQRGQFAVVGGLKGALEGDPEKAFKQFFGGLLQAEEHSVQDILQRYQIFKDSPLAQFAGGLAGDIIADPLTWLTFGTSAIAKGAISGGLKTAEAVTPFLSKFGRQALKEAMETVPEHVAVQAIVDEVRKGTRLGRKLIPHGVRVAHWVPSIGDKRVADFIPLVPGGVVQRVNDLAATNSLLDSVTETLVRSKLVDWFGKAFVPYWDIRRKYPILMEIEKELKAKNHYRAQELIERGKEIVRLLPNEEDRKMLTEMLEQPWLITGKKFVDVTKNEPGIAEIKVNMDYFPAGQEITEDDAEELVDFFLSARNRVDMPRLGAGAHGIVYGKFEPLRPVFEAMKAHPDMKEYRVWMGDWVVKIPGRDIDTGVLPHLDSFQNALADAYVSKRLRGIEGVPQSMIVWRQVKDINPSFNSGGRHRPKPLGEMAQDDSARAMVWGHMVGAWKKYVKGVPEDQREIKTFAEFADMAMQGQIAAEDLFVPIVVKRMAKGTTVANQVTRWQAKMGTNATNDITQTVHEALDLVEKWSETVKNIARTGIGLGDMHPFNIMYDPATKSLNIVDYSFHVDYARGVGAPGHPVPQLGVPKTAEGVPYSVENMQDLDMLITRYGMQDLPAATDVKKLEELVERETIRKAVRPAQMEMIENVRTWHWPQLMPESGIMDLVFGSMKSVVGSPEEVEFLEHMRRAHGKALEAYVAMPGEVLEILEQGVRRIEAKNGKAAAKNFAEEIAKRLDKAGIAKWKVKFDKKTGEFLQFAYDERQYIEYVPIQKVERAEVGRRTWTERVEVVATRHPRFNSMTPEQQDRVLRAYDLSRDWKDEIEQALLNRNLISQERMDGFKKKFGLEHIPHIKAMTNPFDLVTALQTALKNRTKIGSLKGRDIEGAIAEINREFGMEFFESDAATILTKHAIDVAAATDSYDAIAEAARLFGKPMPMKNVKAKNGRIIARPDPEAGYMYINHPALDGIQVPNEVGDWIQRYTKVFSGDKTAKKFWANAHRILGLWKGYATFVNMGFHGRNFVSNLFQLYLKDGPEVMDPMLHRAAVNVMRGRDGEFLLANGSKMTYTEIAELAKRYGVYGTGWFGADIQNTDDVKALLTGGKKVFDGFNPVSFNNYLFQAGKYVGGGIENESRLVGFLADLRRTGNPVFAAENTKKYLFDYTDITDFERDWVKLAIPFWVWMKKNTLLQAEQIIRQPAKYANIERVRQNLEAQSPQADERFIPKYFPEIYAVRTPLKTDQGSPVYLNPNLPFQDLNKVFDPQDWMNSLGPWKAVFELALNKQLFTKKEIQKYEGEVAHAPWLELLPEDMVKKVGPMLGAQRYYDPDNEVWLWGINPKLKYAVETANPFFRNFGKAIAASEEKVPSYAKEKLPYDVLSWITGVKLIPYNPTAELEKSIFQRRDMLRDKKKKAEQRGQIPSKYLPDIPLPETH